MGAATAALSATARPTARTAGCAACSAPTTSTPTACTDGRARTRAASKVLAFYRQIRTRYRSKIRIYLIADNLSAFKKAMADHIQYRNGPHRDRRLLKAERRLLIAA